MSAATRLVWELAGEPNVAAESVRRLLDDSEETATCLICGSITCWSADAGKALGANFTDHSYRRYPGSTRICEACLWCCSGKPPATLRMWSIIAAPGFRLPSSNPKAWIQDTLSLYLFNRSTPELLAAILADPPDSEWVASVAISGQKHVLPYAEVNHGAGQWTVRVEDHNVTATPGQWATVHYAAVRLRRLGVPAESVMQGIPQYIKTRDDLGTWRALNDTLTPWLGSPLLDLALWTITKETMNNDGRTI